MFNARGYLENRGIHPTAIEKMTRQAEQFISNLEVAVGRNLSELEKRKLAWLATDEHETVEVLGKLFKELSDRRNKNACH